MNDLHFEFASTGGGDATGVNDPVTSTFGGNLSYHLARESIQNIIDAKDPSINEPAIAEFNFFERKASELPGIQELCEVFKKCRDTYIGSKEDRAFYERAIFNIEHNSFIPILKISDYNTVGLTGDYNDKEGNYFSLLRAVGSSSKSGPSGGSFGLGKGAYFASSTFRTIFASSIYNGSHFIFQGKARLASFEQDGDLMQGNGSFGHKGQKPVTELPLIPEVFKRSENGTDIFIIGYPDNNWKDNMLKSVLNNFWLSILMGIVEVNIDIISITKDNIEGLLNKLFTEERKDSKDSENPLFYFNAFLRPSKKFEITLPTLGKVELRVLIKEGYPNKIEYTRKTGMVVQKKPKASVKDFAAVFTCNNDEGNFILRKMENPAHNEWRKENVDMKYPDLIEKAKAAEKELNEFINNCITEMQSQENASRTSIGGLEEFLFLPGNEDDDDSTRSHHGQLTDMKSNDETGVEMESEEIVRKINPLIKSVKVKNKEIIPGTSNGSLPISKLGQGHGAGTGGGGDSDDNGDLSLLKPVDIHFRAFAIYKDENILHVVVIRGKKNTPITLIIKGGTEDSLIPLDIKAARTYDGESLSVKKDKVFNVNIDNSGKTELLIEFNDKEKYSLNILAYENK